MHDAILTNILGDLVANYSQDNGSCLRALDRTQNA